MSKTFLTKIAASLLALLSSSAFAKTQKPEAVNPAPLTTIYAVGAWAYDYTQPMFRLSAEVNEGDGWKLALLTNEPFKADAYIGGGRIKYPWGYDITWLWNGWNIPPIDEPMRYLIERGCKVLSEDKSIYASVAAAVQRDGLPEGAKFPSLQTGMPVAGISALGSGRAYVNYAVCPGRVL